MRCAYIRLRIIALLLLALTPFLSGFGPGLGGGGGGGSGGGVSGTYPSGSPPQIGGFSAANVPEAETVSSDCAFTRAGANSYTIACTKTNGTAFGALATLGVGTGLVSSGGNLNVSAFIQAMAASTAMTNYGGL